jgi:hypothetical protein
MYMSEKRDRKIFGKLYEEACELLAQMDTLKEVAIWQDKEVTKYMNKYPDEVIEKMDWEEQERVLNLAEELYGRMTRSVADLVKLGERYERLREKVREQYGRDVMPPGEPFMNPLLGDEEIDLGEEE